MKRLIFVGLAIFMILGFNSVLADKWINGYSKKDGTYIPGHYRTSSDSYRYNNSSSQSQIGTRRDEFSSGLGATNKSNSSWGSRDNDNDGIINSYDRKPESSSNW
ncbi:hypothetical protein HGA88_07045 [Candidatus Roizmanbacteria bacterium]|nr:hypothetical protein [Candidatus Roizmanbacteria bacterium]